MSVKVNNYGVLEDVYLETGPIIPDNRLQDVPGHIFLINHERLLCISRNTESCVVEQIETGSAIPLSISSFHYVSSMGISSALEHTHAVIRTTEGIIDIRVNKHTVFGGCLDRWDTSVTNGDRFFAGMADTKAAFSHSSISIFRRKLVYTFLFTVETNDVENYERRFTEDFVCLPKLEDEISDIIAFTYHTGKGSIAFCVGSNIYCLEFSVTGGGIPYDIISFNKVDGVDLSSESMLFLPSFSRNLTTFNLSLKGNRDTLSTAPIPSPQKSARK